MSDTLRSTFRRVLRRENRRATIRPGRLDTIAGFESGIFGNSRQITIYLPAGYDEQHEKRYPVLYAQDGQNLFDPQRAYVPGQSWRLHEAADLAIGELKARPMIVVGVDHAGPGRVDEFTPTKDAKHQRGGRAADYGRMILEELKPEIDRRYRTEADRIAVGGSSLGGLVSLHLGLTRSDVVSAIAAMSPSVWWANRAILRDVDAHCGSRPRIWLDIGGREGAEALRDARLLRDALRKHGWWDQDLRYFEDRRGDHSERAWARRSRAMLEFLFPPESFPPS